MTNNEKLRKLAKEHKLGRRDIARLAMSTIAKNGQAYSVNNWLADPDAQCYRAMPDSALALLELRLKTITASERAKFEGPLDKAAVIARNRMKRKCFAKGKKKKAA